MTVADMVKKIRELPPDLQQEVGDFIEYLVAKRGQQAKLHLDWAGGLREFRDRFTSVELQHRALDWWGTS